jgi:hypothetical protein
VVVGIKRLLMSYVNSKTFSRRPVKEFINKKLISGVTKLRLVVVFPFIPMA